MSRLRPRTVLLIVLAIAAAIALATGSAGPPTRDPMASRPSPTLTPTNTPAPQRLRARELNRQNRPTRQQRRQQQQAQQQHRLLDQLPVKLAGAEVTVAGIAGDQTRLQLAGNQADALLAQALLASGDDRGRYLADGGGSDDAPQLTCVELKDPVCVAIAYATAAGTYGPASAASQEQRRRRLAVGPLRRATAPAVGDDTQITLVTRAQLVTVSPRAAHVALTLASQRRRGGARTRRASSYRAELARGRSGWRVRSFSIDADGRP